MHIRGIKRITQIKSQGLCDFVAKIHCLCLLHARLWASGRQGLNAYLCVSAFQECGQGWAMTVAWV